MNLVGLYKITNDLYSIGDQKLVCTALELLNCLICNLNMHREINKNDELVKLKQFTEDLLGEFIGSANIYLAGNNEEINNATFKFNLIISSILLEWRYT